MTILILFLFFSSFCLFHLCVVPCYENIQHWKLMWNHFYTHIFHNTFMKLLFQYFYISYDCDCDKCSFKHRLDTFICDVCGLCALCSIYKYIPFMVDMHKPNTIQNICMISFIYRFQSSNGINLELNFLLEIFFLFGLTRLILFLVDGKYFSIYIYTTLISYK